MVRYRVTFWVIVNAVFKIVLTEHGFEEHKNICNENYPNVGTVLFHIPDTHRKCWVDCDALLLQARWIAQSLIPRGKVKADSDSYISAYINYVTNNLETTRAMTKGLAQQMMVMVLADVHGGYLRSVLLPITREAFYSGTVTYTQVIKLFELYERLKALLRTDGEGWRRAPCAHTWVHVAARPLRVQEPTTPGDRRSACDDFITGDHGDAQTSVTPADSNGLKPQCDCTSACRDSATTAANKKMERSVVIPIPFLDDNLHPHSIAVPLRPLSLHSLEAPTAESLVTKYYVAATRCLLARAATDEELFDFNRQFRRWLVGAVLPHLREETLFLGFGGVLRVVESMCALGFERVDEDLLMPVLNEAPKANALRQLLLVARQQGQGTWQSLKGHKSQDPRALKTLAPGTDEDEEEDTKTQKLVPILDNPRNSYLDECTTKRVPQKVSCSVPGPSHGPTTVYQTKSNNQNFFGRGSVDVLLCIILGMLGTLVLWVICACCYCCFLRIKDRRGSARAGYSRRSSKRMSCSSSQREATSLIPQKTSKRSYQSYDGRNQSEEFACPYDFHELNEVYDSDGHPVDEYQCPICFKTFNKSQLQEAMRESNRMSMRTTDQFNPNNQWGDIEINEDACGPIPCDPSLKGRYICAECHDKKLSLCKKIWKNMTKCLKKPVPRRPCICYRRTKRNSMDFRERNTCIEMMERDMLPPCTVQWEGGAPPGCHILMLAPEEKKESMEAIPSASPPGEADAEYPRRSTNTRRKSLPHAIQSRQSNYPLGSW